MVRAVAEATDYDEVQESGLAPRAGSVERAAMELTSDERTELARLIAQEIKRSGASSTMNIDNDENDRSERWRSVLCTGLLGGGLAAAQPPAEPPARGRPGNPAGLSPVEVLNMLDAYALVQAESALELQGRQYGEFVTRLKQLQETRRRNQQARNRQIQELRRMTQPQATAAAGQTRRMTRSLPNV